MMTTSPSVCPDRAWPGTINFRPVAIGSGLPLYRTGSLQCVSMKTAAALQRDLNIQAYIDLRTDSERAQTKDIPTIVRCRVAWIHDPINVAGPSNANETRHSDAWYASWYAAMAAQACDVAERILRRALDVLQAHRGTALIFGCSAGKDRTGLVAAALLAAMQMPHDMILRDFLLSEASLQSSWPALRRVWPEASRQPDFAQRMRPRELALVHFLKQPVVAGFIGRCADLAAAVQQKV